MPSVTDGYYNTLLQNIDELVRFGSEDLAEISKTDTECLEFFSLLKKCLHRKNFKLALDPALYNQKFELPDGTVLPHPYYTRTAVRIRLIYIAALFFLEKATELDERLINKIEEFFCNEEVIMDLLRKVNTEKQNICAKLEGNAREIGFYSDSIPPFTDLNSYRVQAKGELLVFLSSSAYSCLYASTGNYYIRLLNNELSVITAYYHELLAEINSLNSNYQKTRQKKYNEKGLGARITDAMTFGIFTTPNADRESYMRALYLFAAFFSEEINKDTANESLQITANDEMERARSIHILHALAAFIIDKLPKNSSSLREVLEKTIFNSNRIMPWLNSIVAPSQQLKAEPLNPEAEHSNLEEVGSAEKLDFPIPKNMEEYRLSCNQALMVFFDSEQGQALLASHYSDTSKRFVDKFVNKLAELGLWNEELNELPVLSKQEYPEFFACFNLQIKDTAAEEMQAADDQFNNTVPATVLDDGFVEVGKVSLGNEELTLTAEAVRPNAAAM